MRAFAVDEFGATGSIHQIPIPEPGEGEVLITVHAAGVNAIDPWYVAGAMKDYQEHRFPLVAGLDLAGVVDRVGAGVDRFAIGDALYGIAVKPFVGEGTFAEYAVSGVDSLAPKPESLDFAQAAAVPTAGLTALANVETADPQPGQVIVLVGATGGVGSFVTQLAAARGARVVAVGAVSGADQARGYGAAETIDYAVGDVAAALRSRYPNGVDTLISTHGDLEAVTAIARALRPGGLVVSPAFRPDAAAAVLEPLGLAFKAANRLPPSRLPELTALIDGGQLRVPPITTYPLEGTDAALVEMATGHVHGKLVIAVR
ncbi:MAG: NADP-dependent oxidoreductase [Chloroflexota bacterium]|nr:NADP-dependent oxidoreductase [Chloroflexota bacterium]